MDGWTGWMDGWMDGWIEGWMDGSWTNGGVLLKELYTTNLMLKKTVPLG